MAALNINRYTNKIKYLGYGSKAGNTSVNIANRKGNQMAISTVPTAKNTGGSKGGGDVFMRRYPNVSTCNVWTQAPEYGGTFICSGENSPTPPYPCVCNWFENCDTFGGTTLYVDGVATRCSLGPTDFYIEYPNQSIPLKPQA